MLLPWNPTIFGAHRVQTGHWKRTASVAQGNPQGASHVLLMLAEKMRKRREKRRFYARFK
jgi:hypothetical protein